MVTGDEKPHENGTFFRVVCIFVRDSRVQRVASSRYRNSMLESTPVAVHLYDGCDGGILMIARTAACRVRTAR